MRNSFACFSKVISLADAGSSSISFRDTSGGVYQCNYFQVDSRSEGNSDLGYYHVFPSGVYTANTVASSTSSTTNASGAGGLIGVADGSVEYLAPNSKMITSILITNYLGTTGTFVVRYGVLLGVNEDRDRRLLLDYNRGQS